MKSHLSVMMTRRFTDEGKVMMITALRQSFLVNANTVVISVIVVKQNGKGSTCCRIALVLKYPLLQKQFDEVSFYI